MEKLIFVIVIITTLLVSTRGSSYDGLHYGSATTWLAQAGTTVDEEIKEQILKGYDEQLQRQRRQCERDCDFMENTKIQSCARYNLSSSCHADAAREYASCMVACSK